MNHFTALCRSRREYNRHSRDSKREHHRSRHSNKSRHSSRSSSRSSSRNRSHNRHTRRHRSPTPFHISSITTTRPSTAPTNNDIEDNQTQMNKCKDRCPTPVPGTLFTFPDYSDTEYPDSNVSTPIHAQYKGNLTTTNASQDQNSSADSELPVSDTETESNYTIQMDNTNFSSLQDHIVHLPRPPCSPRPTNQHKRPCFNKNQQISSLTRSTDETTSAPASNVMQPNANQCKQPNRAHNTQHRSESHHSYQHHQHQREYPTTQTTNNALQDHQHPITEIQPSQDFHRSTTDLTTNTFQDHHHHHLDTTHIQPFQDQQITVTTCSHTFQDHILHFHHTCTRISSQDHTNRHHYHHYQHHTNRHLDTFHNGYTMYQSYCRTTRYEERIRRQKHRFL